MAVLARPLHSEHSLQYTEHLDHRVIGQKTQALNQPISIDRSELISNHVTIFVLRSASYAKRVRMPTCCEWCNDKCAQMGVQLIR